jgi:hypothetical protein
MTPGNPPTWAPTVAELLADRLVQAALAQAWVDSLPGDPLQRHEEGGWIYLDSANGRLSIEIAPTGQRANLYLGNPPLLAGSVIVGTFHTHPNPTAEGWEPGPSPTDQLSATLTGVPWLIRADDGDYCTGPASRRGGLAGGPGYPP